MECTELISMMMSLSVFSSLSRMGLQHSNGNARSYPAVSLTSHSGRMHIPPISPTLKAAVR